MPSSAWAATPLNESASTEVSANPERKNTVSPPETYVHRQLKAAFLTFYICGKVYRRAPTIQKFPLKRIIKGMKKNRMAPPPCNGSLTTNAEHKPNADGKTGICGVCGSGVAFTIDVS